MSKAKGTQASTGAKEKVRTVGDSHNIYMRLRRDILSCALPPGEILNSVHLSHIYNVSRTPVREALRMLQTEGLVDAPYQHRMRVTAVTPDEVDAVYATWILMQSLAVGLTVAQTTPQELEELRSALEAMNKIAPINARSKSAWDKLHIHYSKLVIRHAGPEIKAAIENCWLRSERARGAKKRNAPSSWMESEADHKAVVRAFENKSGLEAMRLMSKHMARIALEVIHKIDPDYTPKAIHQALLLTYQGHPGVHPTIESGQRQSH